MKNEYTIDVSYASSNEFVMYAYISIFSLLENNKNIDDINLHYISNGVDDINKKRLVDLVKSYSRKIEFIELSDVVPNGKLDVKFPAATYAKLFLSNVIKADKIIHIDCDTLILNSLQDLWNIDMENNAIAGVIDNITYNERCKIFDNKNNNYINAGNTMINLKYWRENNLDVQCLNCINKYDGNVPMADQGVINMVLNSCIKIIEPIYNAMPPMFVYSAKQLKKMYKLEDYYSDMQLYKVRERPTIVHFTINYFNRPWNEPCYHPLKETYRYYMEQTIWKNEIIYNPIDKKTKFVYFLHNHFPFWMELLFYKLIEVKKLLIRRK